MEGFLLLYETFRLLFSVSFKQFDFRNEIMLRTPDVCVASKLLLSIIDFFPYNICCWWIIYYQLKIFNSNTFFLFLKFFFIYLLHFSCGFSFSFPRNFVLFFCALVLLCDYFFVWLQGNLRKVNVERVQCLTNMGWNSSSRLSYWVPLETIKFVFLSYIFPRNWTSDKILGFMLLYGLFSEHIRTAQAR